MLFFFLLLIMKFCNIFLIYHWFLHFYLTIDCGNSCYFSIWLEKFVIFLHKRLTNFEMFFLLQLTNFVIFPHNQVTKFLIFFSLCDQESNFMDVFASTSVTDCWILWLHHAIDWHNSQFFLFVFLLKTNVILICKWLTNLEFFFFFLWPIDKFYDIFLQPIDKFCYIFPAIILKSVILFPHDQGTIGEISV